jgi:hypothetical protein
MTKAREQAVLSAIESKFIEAETRIYEAKKILSFYVQNKNLESMGGLDDTPRRKGLYPGMLDNHVDETDECTS